MIHDNFNNPNKSDFTRIGGSTDITFTTDMGDLVVQKLTQNWDVGGLSLTGALVAEAGMEFTLFFVPVTIEHINDANASAYILGLQASNTALPTTPALTNQTYGFCVSNAKAAAQNAYAGNHYGAGMVAGETYELIQTIDSDTGNLVVDLYGGNNDGNLWTVPGDFRGYFVRFCMNFYWNDTVRLKSLVVK